MRSNYPRFSEKSIIEDLKDDKFPISSNSDNAISKFISSASATPALLSLDLKLDKPLSGKLSFVKKDEGIQIHVSASHSVKKIVYSHDALHFPETPNFDQLINYLNGGAILMERKSKEGEIGEYFIQAIPESFDKGKIKHLKLHPKQTYLMVSNSYLNMKPNSDSFKVGGRAINQYEFAQLKNGYSVALQNPWFFVPKQDDPKKLEKIKIFGTFSYSIDLFKKSYKKIDKVKPHISTEELANSIQLFVAGIKNIIGTNDYERKIIAAMETAASSKPGDWNYLFNHMIYGANVSYLKSETDQSVYTYPYQYGYELNTEIKSQTVILYPAGKSIESPIAIELTDPVSIVETLLKSQQINESISEIVIEELTNNNNSALKI